MTEALQRAASWQEVWVFSQYFVRIYSRLLAFIPNDVVDFIYLMEIEMNVSVEVRQGRTAVPHHQRLDGGKIGVTVGLNAGATL